MLRIGKILNKNSIKSFASLASKNIKLKIDGKPC